MKRRQFITLLGGGTLAWPLAAHAQQGERALRRIGVLMGIADDQEGQSRLSALKQGLQEAGWTDSHNIKIDLRWGAGDIRQIRSDARCANFSHA
jgi:putative ABC transport system substrate-binding protein